MTTEEKARAYDKALEKATDFHKGYKQRDNLLCADDLETIFPELKESDDEQSKNWILEYLHDGLRKSDEQFKDQFKCAIDWLEKQGKESNWKPSKEEMDVLYGLSYITNQYDEHKEEVITRLYQDLKREFFNSSSYENMFPTNTEDDVRRRSTIQVLEYARSLDAYNQYGKADIDKNIAWLEKKGEQKSIKEHNACEFCEDRYGCVSPCSMKLVEEEKPADKVEPKFKVGDEIKTKNEESLIITRIDRWGYWSEDLFICNFDDADKWKLVEQKPTDKVEPKFKVGDWVVSPNGVYWHIDAINNNRYEVSSTDGVCADWPLDTDLYHLWTIQDSKRGDVLACPNDAGDRDVVFIFKNINTDEGWVFCFCAIDANGCFCTNNDYVGNSNSTNISPATKEQHNALMKAMADAGYTFDFEKKELKKIDNEEINGEDYGIDSLWHDQRILEKTLGEVEGYQSDDGILDHKAAITAVKLLYKQNPAVWSEEDESYLNTTIAYLKDAKEFKKTAENCINWLESLKGRVRPPKQEWSEDDVRNIQDIDSVLFYDKNLPEDTCIRLRNWLKSLRPQSTWKPSEEQMKSLSEASEIVGMFTQKGINLHSLYQDLMKLTE